MEINTIQQEAKALGEPLAEHTLSQIEILSSIRCSQPAMGILQDFLNMVNSNYEYSSYSHAKKVVSLFEEAVKEETGNIISSCPGNILLNSMVIKRVVSMCSELGSVDRLLSLCRKLILFCYGVSPIIIKYNPEYHQLLAITRLRPVTEYKNILSPYKEEHPLLDQFIRYLEEKNYRSNVNDKKSIHLFLVWLAAYEPDFISEESTTLDVRRITETHLLNYKKHLDQRVQESQIISETASGYFGKVKRWLKYLYEIRAISYNPSIKIKINWTRTKRNIPLITSVVIKNFLMTIFIHSTNPLEELALFSLYLITGLRSVSVVGTQVSDFDPITKTLLVTLKGGDQHIQKLPSISTFWIQNYLHSRAENIDDIRHEPLWLNRFGRKLGYYGILFRFRKYKKLANLHEDIVGPHFFRHLYYSEQVNALFKFETIVTSTGVASEAEIEDYLHCKPGLYERFLASYPKLKK